jgi:hypothetical protein
MRLLTYLPQEFTEKGITFKVVPGDRSNKEIIAECKANGLKYRQIKTLQKSLRGKRDLHGMLYKPLEWVFIEKKITYEKSNIIARISPNP